MAYSNAAPNEQVRRDRLQSALYRLLDALGSRNLIEGRRKSAVQGRVFGVTAGASTPFAFRSVVCLSVAAATLVLQTVWALSFLMVRLLWLCDTLRRSYGSVGTPAHLCTLPHIGRVASSLYCSLGVVPQLPERRSHAESLPESGSRSCSPR